MPAPPPPDLVAEVARADALVLTAASAARAFLALRGPDGRPVPAPVHVVCLGPTTAAAARAGGLSGVVQVGTPTPEGIVAELTARFGGGDAS